MTRIINAETRIPYLILLIVFIISIYPFFYMISTSLMTAGEASNQYLFPKKLMFENYYITDHRNRKEREYCEKLCDQSPFQKLFGFFFCLFRQR